MRIAVDSFRFGLDEGVLDALLAEGIVGSSYGYRLRDSAMRHAQPVRTWDGTVSLRSASGSKSLSQLLTLYRRKGAAYHP